MRHRTFAIVAALVVLAVSAALAQSPFSKDPATERKITELLARMTLEEKIGQTVQFNGDGAEGNYDELIKQGRVGSLLNVLGAKRANALQRLAVEQSRLKIPLIFGFDVIHGYRTTFPIPLAESCSWNPEMLERTARVAGREASAAGIRWTFAPMVDIARDARWGRIAEGAGEDTYLGSVMAAARVRGFQGSGLKAPDSVVACVKHFVGYGAAEAGRDYNTVDMSELRLREVYLPPFKAGLDAGAGTLMSAFNDLNGVPCTANSFILTKILRQEWGFQGFVVSDWDSVAELLAHGVAATPEEAAAKAINAGVDMDMHSGTYLRTLGDAIRDRKVSEATLDEAVRHILRVKFALGLFDNPYVDESLEGRELLSPQNQAEALEMARQSIVLLKNRNDLLPLSKGVKKIALIGPLADSQTEPLGPWSGDSRAQDVVTVMAGIKNKLGPETRILYAKGADILGSSQSGFAEAIETAIQADVAVVVLGEKADMSGEAASRAILDLPGVQQQLLRAIVATGKPCVLVLMNGRPLTLDWEAEHVPAILETWFLGTQTGNAIADVLFGDYNPSGKLTTSFPRVVGQLPLYYNHRSTGRPATDQKYTSRYLDVPNDPLFPFGFGLSYTTFEYSDLKVDPDLRVTVNVKNTGKREGHEVVQLYIRDLVASTTRPVRELKGFQRVKLAPGESRTVEFQLTRENLALYNPEMQKVVEPGAFKLWVGGSSDGGLEAGFEIK
jgi:beta-glucosidase